jgi:hypothetical protein
VIGKGLELPTRQALELALAAAEARLREAVNAKSAPGSDQGKCDKAINAARATCRKAHAALNGLSRSAG